MGLEDNIAVVTGAASGIGRAIALKFASEGAKVVVADIREQPREGGEPTHQKIQQEYGSEALFIETDVTDWESVEGCAEEVYERFGNIDIWVNNAGVLETGSIDETSIKDWQKTMDVNLGGVFYGTKAAAQFMEKQSSGEIVNISSGLGKKGMSPYISYCASKFGVIGLTEAVADDLRGSGISVNAVCPGMTATSMTGFTGDNPEKVARTVLSVVESDYTGRAVDVS